AISEGRKARELAKELIEHCGFVDVVTDVKVGNGIEISLSGVDARRQLWYFDVSGAFTSTRAGLRKAETLWKTLGRAAVVHASHPEIPLVLITTDAPTAGSSVEQALRALIGSGGSGAVFDVIELESAD